MSNLVLASASPRRREMLALLCDDFRVVAADVCEDALPGESPADLTVRLAMLKADTVFARESARTSGDKNAGELAVLGGDTVVAIGDDILGKPANRAQATAMLQRLSGETHTVFSAVALVAERYRNHRLSATKVTFARLESRQIARYCAGDEPYDKAGAYAIQGAAAAFVTQIAGSPSGVIGLPLWETAQLLRDRQHHAKNRPERFFVSEA